MLDPIARSVFIVGLCFILMAPAGAITPGVSGDAIWYYEIGGARPVSVPPNANIENIRLHGTGELGLGYSCLAFDPLFNIAAQLQRVVDRLKQFVVNALSAALAAAPLYILQRASPGLYDLLQNALLKAEAAVDLATQSCEQLEAQIVQGKDPFREWATLAKSIDWKVRMGRDRGSIDIVSAHAEVEENNGENGLPWIGGMRGGRGQEPIRVVGDTVRAGYNVTLNRAPQATGAPTLPEGERPHLVEVWASPEEARDWAVSVLGEIIVTTCAGCPKESIPGGGLLPMIDRTSERIAKTLADLVAEALPINLDNLEKVSAPGVAMTLPAIEALRRMPMTDQATMLGRLAEEIATARVLDRALLARRLLMTGRRVPEVHGAGMATEEIREVITELDREIEALTFEGQVRRQLVSNTLAIILRRQHALEVRAYGREPLPVEDPGRLRGGAVRLPEEEATEE